MRIIVSDRQKDCDPGQWIHDNEELNREIKEYVERVLHFPPQVRLTIRTAVLDHTQRLHHK
jgi:hypothetical protein